MDTISKVLIIAGLGVAGFVIYKLFIDPQRGNHIGQKLREVELKDPKDVAKLKAAGIDVDKLAKVFDPHGVNKEKDSKSLHGRYMSYF